MEFLHDQNQHYNYYETTMLEIARSSTIIQTNNMKILMNEIILHSMLRYDVEKQYEICGRVNKSFEMEELYKSKAKIEYHKMIKYFNHITNNNPYKYKYGSETTIIANHLIIVNYPKECDANPPPEIPMNTPLNKYIIICIKRIREKIEQIKEKIEFHNNYIKNFIDPSLQEKQGLNTTNIILFPLKKNTDDNGLEMVNSIENNITIIQNELQYMENKIII